MAAAGIRTQVQTIQCTRGIGVGRIGLVMCQYISAAGCFTMKVVGEIFLMNDHPRAKVFRNTLPSRKNVRFSRALVRQIFDQDAWEMSERESMIDGSRLFLDDPIVALSLGHVFLCGCIVHSDRRVS